MMGDNLKLNNQIKCICKTEIIVTKWFGPWFWQSAMDNNSVVFNKILSYFLWNLGFCFQYLGYDLFVVNKVMNLVLVHVTSYKTHSIEVH
jgi:hypothetical protein